MNRLWYFCMMGVCFMLGFRVVLKVCCSLVVVCFISWLVLKGLRMKVILGYCVVEDGIYEGLLIYICLIFLVVGFLRKDSNFCVVMFCCRLEWVSRVIGVVVVMLKRVRWCWWCYLNVRVVRFLGSWVGIGKVFFWSVFRIFLLMLVVCWRVLKLKLLCSCFWRYVSRCGVILEVFGKFCMLVCVYCGYR